VDVVIPVYNEEPILSRQLDPVLQRLPGGFSLTVVENGSTDATPDMLRSLQGEHPESLRVLSLAEANYGRAMLEGILASGAEVVVTDDLDVMDTDFWARGLRELRPGGVDLVQGSKVLAGRSDRRPLVRKAATLVLTFFLRALLGYRGTDTHGPKVFGRAALAPVAEACRMELDILPTELVVRAQRAGLTIVEIPIHLRELRPTPLPLYRRVPRALRDLVRLALLLRREPGA
jgi:glycosyltransferase involved in cell wall biosynthesis